MTACFRSDLASGPALPACRSISVEFMLAQLIPLDNGIPITLNRDITIVGRKRGLCDLIIDRSSISKLHCMLVKTDGLLFVRDLMRPDDNATVNQLIDTYAKGQSHRARQLFNDSLRAALNLQEIRSLVGRLGFNTDSVQPTSDRHWTWCQNG